jgi:hypothetical protein
MQKINSAADLREAILQLESRQAEEARILKSQIQLIHERIKPGNLLKTAFKEFTQPGDLKDNIVNTTVGLAAGYISKTLYERTSNSPVKKFLGSVIMFGITNLVSKNTEPIKLMGTKLLDMIRSKSDKIADGFEN